MQVKCLYLICDCLDVISTSKVFPWAEGKIRKSSKNLKHKMIETNTKIVLVNLIEYWKPQKVSRFNDLK